MRFLKLSSLLFAFALCACAVQEKQSLAFKAAAPVVFHIPATQPATASSPNSVALYLQNTIGKANVPWGTAPIIFNIDPIPNGGAYWGFTFGQDSNPIVSNGSTDIWGYIPGTASCPVTIQQTPGTTGSLIISFRDNKTPDGIDLEPGNSFVTLNDITINQGTNTTISGYGIKIADSPNCTVTNSTATNCGATGFYTSNCNGTLFKNDNSYGNGEHGFYLANTGENQTVEDCISNGNANGGIQFNADATIPPPAGFTGTAGVTSGNVIRWNIVENNGNGLTINGTAHAGGGGALNMDGLQYSTIEGNLLFNNHSSGLVLYQGDAAEGSIYNQIDHNTIVMATGARPALNNTEGNGTTGSFGNVFDDDIFLGNMDVDAESTPGLWKNNILLSGYSNQGVYAFPAGITSTAVSLFSDASGAFTLATDYDLKTGSPAIGAGVSSVTVGSTVYNSVLTDVFGNTFNSPPDIGAVASAKSAASPPQITVPASATVSSLMIGLSVGATDPQGSPLTYTWSSTPNTDIATQGENALASLSAAGTYTFTVTVTDALGLSATSTVTATEPQTPTSLSISPSTENLTAGTAQELSSSELDQFGNEIAFTPEYTLSGVGQITNGVFESNAAGNSVITVTSGSLTATCNVTVVPAAPATVAVTYPQASYAIGAVATPSAVVKDAYGNVITNPSIQWSPGAYSFGQANPITGAVTVGITFTETATVGAISGSGSFTVTP